MRAPSLALRWVTGLSPREVQLTLCHRPCAGAEDLLPGAEVHGKDEQAVFVDEVVFDECLGEPAAAVNLQFIARAAPWAWRPRRRRRRREARSCASRRNRESSRLR